MRPAEARILAAAQVRAAQDAQVCHIPQHGECDREQWAVLLWTCALVPTQAAQP
jgi:hypothetical protein